MKCELLRKAIHMHKLGGVAQYKVLIYLIDVFDLITNTA